MWGVAKRLLKPLAGFIAQRLERSGNAGEVHRTEGSADIPVRGPVARNAFKMMTNATWIGSIATLGVMSLIFIGH